MFFLALFTILAGLVQIALLRVLSLDELSFLREEVLGSAVVDQTIFLRRAEVGWQLFLLLFHFVSIVYRLATRREYKPCARRRLDFIRPDFDIRVVLQIMRLDRAELSCQLNGIEDRLLRGFLELECSEASSILLVIALSSGNWFISLRTFNDNTAMSLQLDLADLGSWGLKLADLVRRVSHEGRLCSLPTLS